jgi:transposase
MHGFKHGMIHPILLRTKSHEEDRSSLKILRGGPLEPLTVNRRAKRAKTDRIDAKAMIRALMAYTRGEDQVLSTVQIPSVEQDDERRLMRERQRLVKERTAHTNRIKGLLLTQGIVGFDARADGADRRLDELVTGDGRRLGPRLKDEVRREIGRLRLVMEQPDHVDDERDAIAIPKRASTCEGARNEDNADTAMITALARIKGVGPNDASVLVREAFWRKFANRREIAAWSGFAPTPWASGTISREQGITKAGPASFRAYVIRNPTHLALAAMAASEPTRAVVRRTDEWGIRPHAQDHDCRARSQAAGRTVALRDDRAAPNRRRRRLI